MKYIPLIFILISSCATAKMVSNAKEVELYKKQLDETQRIITETNETLRVSNAIYKMYERLGYITPEVATVSRHFMSLQEDAKNLYGENLVLTPTPFNSCATVPMAAYSVWMAKVSSVKTNKTDSIKPLGDAYVKQATECLNAINNPPPAEVEESEDLEIIDVSP